MGLVDLQVNGYGGINFNQDDLSVEGLYGACVKLRRDGVDQILATIITESLSRMRGRLQKLVELREQYPLIADGTHVPFFALANYLRIAALDRCIIVSDSIAPAGLGPGRYTLSRWELAIGDDLVARSIQGGNLVGSAISLSRSAQNLRNNLGFDETEVR